MTRRHKKPEKFTDDESQVGTAGSTSCGREEQVLRQALQEAEREKARADAFLAAIGDPLTILDKNFRIIFRNEAAKQIMGGHMNECCYQAYHGRSEICDGCSMAKTYADGKVHRVVKKVTLDKETKYFEIITSPLLDKDGRPTAGIEIARDITERMRWEDLLAEQVRLFSLGADIGSVLTKARTVREMLAGCCQLLVQHLDAAFARVWTVDDTGNLLILQGSAGMYTHLDGPHGRIPVNRKTKIGTIGSTRLPHATNKVVGDPGVTDQEWAKRQGMVAFAGHPLLIEDRLVGVVGMFFRHQLSESVSRAMSTIADEVALGIERLRTEEKLWRSNRALRILSRCNEALIQIFTEQELLQRICDIIVEPEGYLMAWVGMAERDVAKSIRPVAHAGLEKGYLDEVQVSWDDSEAGKGPSGTAVRTGEISLVKNLQYAPEFAPWRLAAIKRGYASSIGLPLTDSRARPFGVLSIYSSEPAAFDAEELKLLTELAADLSFGINGIRLQAERERELEEKRKLEERLRHAQKLEAIGTLAGGIAHDFNNILSSILGYAELALGETGAQTKAGKDLRQVITAGRRAADLVRQILAISRQSKLERQPLAIQYIVKEALKLLRPTISAAVQIKSNIDPDCPKVLVDPTEIHQVIMNLCTNAYHAIQQKESGERLMEIGVEQIDLDEASVQQLGLTLVPGPFVKLTVADTGYGMDEQIQSRIFDPYFTTKQKGQGTGLGLATVQSIVAEAGGEVSVESEIGQGSVFHVYLPAYAGPTLQGKAGEDSLSATGGTERILVVDDEKPLALLLQRTFEACGYQATAFTGFEDAMRFFSAQPDAVDLVITDMNMPKTMGTELARAFLAVRPGLPIVLCTGFSEKIDLPQAKAMGIRELLYKPVKKDELIRTVRQILDEDAKNKGR